MDTAQIAEWVNGSVLRGAGSADSMRARDVKIEHSPSRQSWSASCQLYRRKMEKLQHGVSDAVRNVHVARCCLIAAPPQRPVHSRLAREEALRALGKVRLLE